MLTPDEKIRRILEEKLELTRVKNPSFSLRAFAKKLDLAPSALSEMLQGKRIITQKTGAKVLEKLMVDPAESHEILISFQSMPKRRKKDGHLNPYTREYIQLISDQFHIVSEWYCFAILSLLETDNAQHNSQWIAKRLEITEEQAQNAIDRMIRVGLIRQNINGTLELTGQQFTTTTDVPDYGIKKYHEQNFELARDAMYEGDVNLRDFTSITMAIDPQKLPEAKKMILNFRRSLCEFLESGAKKEVYRLNMQLLALTKDETALKKMVTKTV